MFRLFCHPTQDFAELLPLHFADLMAALPHPHHTQRSGHLNLVSKLPAYMLPPDLGPKLYLAYGSLSGGAKSACSFGTTCLHMDMADAVNVMVFVQPTLHSQEHTASEWVPSHSTETPFRSKEDPRAVEDGERPFEADVSSLGAEEADELKWLLSHGRQYSGIGCRICFGISLPCIDSVVSLPRHAYTTIYIHR